MSTPSVLQKIEPVDPNDAVLSEILAINSALSDLQGRVSRLAQHLATKQVTVSIADFSESILQAVADTVGLPDELMRPATADEMDGGSDTLGAPLEPLAEGSKASPASGTPRSPTFERALDAYAEGTETASQIGKRVGILASTVRAYLSMGRKVGDPRVVKGDAARQMPVATSSGAQDEPEDEDVVETVIVVVEEPSEPAVTEEPTPTSARLPNTGLSDVRIYRPQPRPAEDEEPRRLRLPSVPAAHSPRIEMPAVASQSAPVADFDPDKIIVVDVTGPRVYGPLGDIAVSRPFAQTVERMADGGLYDAVTLRDAGAWPTAESMRTHFTFMVPKLKAIGIELVMVSKDFFKLRRLEA